MVRGFISIQLPFMPSSACSVPRGRLRRGVLQLTLSDISRLGGVATLLLSHLLPPQLGLGSSGNSNISIALQALECNLHCSSPTNAWTHPFKIIVANPQPPPPPAKSELPP